MVAVIAEGSHDPEHVDREIELRSSTDREGDRARIVLRGRSSTDREGDGARAGIGV
jgi:hypothetical protein